MGLRSHGCCAIQQYSMQPSPRPLHQIRCSLSATVKPVIKQLQQLPTRLIRLPESLKTAPIKLLDAIVDSTFKFVEQPMLLQRNFAPVEEIGEAVVVSQIEGEIPEDFPVGVYIRTGPNPMFSNKTATESVFGKSSCIWFEGHGMLHATYFRKDEEGKWVLSYRNRYVEAETFMAEKEKNKPFLPAVEGDAPAILAAYLLNLLRFGKVNRDLNNTSLLEHAGRVYSLTENHLPYEIDVSNLDTLNICTWDGAWTGPFCSHPKRAPRTGELVTIGTDAIKPYFVLGIISADGLKLVHKVDLEFQRSILSHEVGVTDNYNVIMDHPLTVDIGRLIKGGSLIKYVREEKARIGIMPRYGDAASVKWFDVQPHCTFHIINSFEEGDEVVVLGCRARGSIIPGPEHGINKHDWFRRAFRPPSLAAGADEEDIDPSVDGILFPLPYEWRLNMKTGLVSEGYLEGAEFPMEFPTINDCFVGVKNKYAYLQVLDSDASSKTGLSVYKMFAKLHLQGEDGQKLEEGKRRAKIEYHVLDENEYCTGLQFVRKSIESHDEDDGWLVSYVHNESTGISQVHIIDAKKFAEKPAARITLPQRVPYGFHGIFVCSDQKLRPGSV